MRGHAALLANRPIRAAHWPVRRGLRRERIDTRDPAICLGAFAASELGYHEQRPPRGQQGVVNSFSPTHHPSLDFVYSRFFLFPGFLAGFFPCMLRRDRLELFFSFLFPWLPGFSLLRPGSL